MKANLVNKKQSMERPAASSQRSSQSSSKQSLSWLLPFSLLVLAIVVVPLQIFDDQGLPRYRQLRNQLASEESENRSLRAEAEQLREEVARLRGNPAAIESVARDDLGMVRSGEIIFQFDNTP